jgi:hypothetical protein
MRLLLLLAVAGCGCLTAEAVEAWVVNEGSRNITVIEADGEQVLGTIDLSDVTAPPGGAWPSAAPRASEVSSPSSARAR